MDGNTLLNTGRLLLRTMDLTAGGVLPLTSICRHRHGLAWGNWISNNTVTNTSGNLPAKISVYSANVDGVGYGNMILDTEVRGNTVNACVPNTTYPDESGGTEGYYNMVVMTNNKVNTSTISNFASRLLGNTSTNITSPYYTNGCGLLQLLSTGSLNITF
jgi:hypothetical protein